MSSWLSKAEKRSWKTFFLAATMLIFRKKTYLGHFLHNFSKKRILIVTSLSLYQQFWNLFSTISFVTLKIMNIQNFISKMFSYQDLCNGDTMLQPNTYYIYDLLNYIYLFFKGTTTKKGVKEIAKRYQT